MLSIIRTKLVNILWDKFKPTIPNYDLIFKNQFPIIDHFAIIDLKCEKSGIAVLKKIFEKLGFVQRGKGYIPEKVNDFIWMADIESLYAEARSSLPQIVLADFRMELLSSKAQSILNKYISKISEFDFKAFDKLLALARKGDGRVESEIINMVINYINNRPWQMPSFNDYNIIQQENELIAWTLLFGRKVNHFGIAVHLQNSAPSFEKFKEHLYHSKLVEFNSFEGLIKGNKKFGIEQAASLGQKVKIALGDHFIETRDCFIEFVWRHSQVENPQFWSDYFTGFIPSNANVIIESLYNKDINKTAI